MELQEERCATFIKIRAERLEALALNAWLIFKKNHLRAKDYWFRIFVRLDLKMKR